MPAGQAWAAPPEQHARNGVRVDRLQYIDINDYLTNDILFKVDRMSKAHSIEVRSPLLDYQLMEFMASVSPRLRMSNGTTKVLFRRLLKNMLPKESFRKPKQGFGIPVAEWFRKDLYGFAKEVLLDPDCFSWNFLQSGMILRILKDHENGARDYSEWIWYLVILELWYRRFRDSLCSLSNCGST